MKFFITFGCFLFLMLSSCNSTGEEHSNVVKSPDQSKKQFQSKQDQNSYAFGMSSLIDVVLSFEQLMPTEKPKIDQIQAGLIDVLNDTIKIEKSKCDSILVDFISSIDQKSNIEGDYTFEELNYAYGVINMTEMKKQFEWYGVFDSLNIEMVELGITDAVDGNEQFMDSKTANTFSEIYISERIKRFEEKFLLQNSQRSDVSTLPSGLQYQVLKSGDGTQPRITDRVFVYYTGQLSNGTIFDAAPKDTIPMDFILSETIPGLEEGISLMKKSAQYRFFIPYFLGYGEETFENIPGFSTLIFDVELNDVAIQ